MGNLVVRGEQARVRCSTFFHLQDAAYDRPHCLRSNCSKGSPRVPLYIEAILITSIPRPTLPSLPFLTPLLPFSFMGHPCCLLPFLPPPPQTGQTVLVRNRPRRPPLTCAAKGHQSRRPSCPWGSCFPRSLSPSAWTGFSMATNEEGEDLLGPSFFGRIS